MTTYTTVLCVCVCVLAGKSVIAHVNQGGNSGMLKRTFIRHHFSVEHVAMATYVYRVGVVDNPPLHLTAVHLCGACVRVSDNHTQ